MFTAARKEDTIDTASHTAHHVADEARHGARRVLNDVKEGLEHTADVAKEDLQEIAHRAGRQVRDLAGSAEETLITKIHEKPIQSSLIALGLGFIAGSIMMRR